MIGGERYEALRRRALSKRTSRTIRELLLGNKVARADIVKDCAISDDHEARLVGRDKQVIVMVDARLHGASAIRHVPFIYEVADTGCRPSRQALLASPI